MRDRLILLHSSFTDSRYPGESFYCKVCIVLEGVLARFTELNKEIDIEVLPA